MTLLRQRMLEDIGIRNFAEHTQQSYLQQVSLFARHFARSPNSLGPEQVREYQVHLVEDRKLAPSSISIAVSALRFLYKVRLRQPWAVDDIPMPKKPFRLPVVLSPEEVTRFLESVHRTKHRAILTSLYAAGLRVSEATHLKVTDIDSQRMMLRVDQGKGQKDRYVMLSPRLLEELRAYWKVGRPETWLFPGGHSWSPHDEGCRRTGLQQGKPRLGHHQAGHAAFPQACLRHPYAGARRGRAQNPVADGPSQPWRRHRVICGSPPARSAPPPAPWTFCRTLGRYNRGPLSRLTSEGRSAPRGARGGGHLPPDRACVSSRSR